MTHQIAEYKHQHGTISVYDKGIIISFGEEQVYLGEEFVANYDLFCAFMGLVEEGLATGFGGFVSGNEGFPPTEQFMVHHVTAESFILSDDSEDEGFCWGVDLDFLEFLRTSCACIVLEGDINEEKEHLDWSIYGSFPWTDLTFAISKSDFEIYIPSPEGTCIFATSVEDRILWLKALAIAGQMLERKLTDGSWQIVKVRESTNKTIRLEPKDGGMLFSLRDPAMPGVNASVHLDDVMIYAIELLLASVWMVDETDLVMAEFAYDEEDDDD